MSDGEERASDASGIGDTSATLLQVLIEQQRIAQAQQAAQQEMLMKLVEQQREEVARCREEMRVPW